jgi:hypothetical protein
VRLILEPYRQWRDKGLRVMREALGEGKRVVAITADVRQFYHRTSPDFLLNDKYLNEFEMAEKIGGDERRFTKALIEAIHAWARQTPLHQDDPSVGIPVGLVP